MAPTEAPSTNRRRRRTWKLAALLMLGVLLWADTFTESVPMHPSWLWTGPERRPETVRLLTYNIKYGSDYLRSRADSLSGLLALIDDADADIVVLPESRLHLHPRLHRALTDRYRYELGGHAGSAQWETSIYSRYPLSQARAVGGHYIYAAEVTLGEGRRAMLVACHLASNQRNGSLTRGGLWSNLRHGHLTRLDEAQSIRDSIAGWTGALWVCGDLNDLSGSPVLRRLQGGADDPGPKLADAWWRGGFGYGATFAAKGLRLRLDHILYTPAHLELVAVRVANAPYSDHRPLVADFRLRP